jgi:hypothetical protein
MHDILIPYGEVRTVFVQRIETWCKTTNTHTKHGINQHANSELDSDPQQFLADYFPEKTHQMATPRAKKTAAADT